MEIAAVIFVLVGLAIAYVVFRILKKSVKLAIRAMIVLVLMFLTISGGFALWYSDAGKTTKKSTQKR